MGVVTLDRDISKTATLKDALQVLLLCSPNQFGTIRVIAGRITGFLTISNGFIRGAAIPSTGEKGIAAINQLLSLSPAQFNFSPRKEHAERLIDQGLQIHIESVIGVVTSIPTNQPTRQNKPAFELNMPKINVPKVVQAPCHESLTPAQLKLLQVYRKLNGPMDRMAFLKENPEFVRLIEGDVYVALTAERRHELDRAIVGESESDVLSFLEFHRRAVGDTENVSDTQIELLRKLYRQLQTEERRRAFLAQNVLMDDSLALSRGEDIWIKEQAERIKALDAIKEPEIVLKDSNALVAMDGDYRIYEKEKFHKTTANKRRMTGEVVLPVDSGPLFWWLRPEVIGVGVAISLLGATFLLIYSYLMQNAFVAAGTPEEDMVTMDFILAEAMGVGKVPRAILKPQIAKLVEGGLAQRSASGAASTESGEQYQQRLQLADRLKSKGRYKDAAAVLTPLLKHHPQYSTARVQLVRCYLMFDKEQARQAAIVGVKIARSQKERAEFESLFLQTINR